MKKPFKSVAATCIAAAGLLVATQAMAQVTLYENDNFQGRSFSTQSQVNNLVRRGFNDRASSAMVFNNRWEVCEDIRFGGRCVVLRPGRYPSLSAMGINDRISSVRVVNNNVRIEDNRWAPPPPLPVYDNRRRNGEGLYEANISSVRAVVGPPTQRCWVEREQIVQNNGAGNAPAVIVGALLGGVLGHQFGGGTGKDLATAGGAIAGATLGSNIASNNNGQTVVTQNVQRCATVPNQSQADYWDVTYIFRGQEHRVQMASPPGRVIMVNRRGEPRS